MLFLITIIPHRQALATGLVCRYESLTRWCGVPGEECILTSVFEKNDATFNLQCQVFLPSETCERVTMESGCSCSWGM